MESGAALLIEAWRKISFSWKGKPIKNLEIIIPRDNLRFSRGLEGNSESLFREYVEAYCKARRIFLHDSYRLTEKGILVPGYSPELEDESLTLDLTNLVNSSAILQMERFHANGSPYPELELASSSNKKYRISKEGRLFYVEELKN